MKRSFSDINSDSTGTPLCYELVLEHCGDYGTMIQSRFVSSCCWTEHLAFNASKNLVYEGDPYIIDVLSKLPNHKEKFDALYKRAYRFARPTNYMPDKEWCKFGDTCGNVVDVSDCIDESNNDKLFHVEFTQACTLSIEAIDEAPCDSHAWFDYPRNYNSVYMKQMIGKKLVGIMMLKNGLDTDQADFGHDDDYDDDRPDITHYFFLTACGQQFPFTLLHRSNGYYSGSLECKWHFPDNGDWKEEELKHCPNAEMIIIVGLPASGKSTYAKQNYQSMENCVMFDDEQFESGRYGFHNYFCDLARHQLAKDGKICFVSALLCVKERYKNFIDEFPRFIRNRTRTICFDNDPIACRANNEIRSQLPEESPGKTCDKILRDINYFSGVYEPHHKTYKNVQLLPVYKNNVQEEVSHVDGDEK